MKEFFKRNWLDIIGAACLGLVVVVAVVSTVDALRTPATPQIAAVAPEVAHVATELIKPATVKVYKAPAKVKLAATGAVPKSIVADTNQSVVAASRVESSERPTTVTTVINASTGESETYVAPAPRPWLAVENRGAISLEYGLKMDTRAGGTMQPVTRINIHQDLVQIKALHLGVTASGYSDGTAFIGAGISYRW